MAESNFSFKRLARDILRNRSATAGVGIIGFMTLAMVFGPSFLPYEPNDMDFMAIREGPSWIHPFGTDAVGRDVLARVLYGARISMLVTIIGVTLGGAAGTMIGMTSGFVGRWVDPVVMRFVDLLMAFPIFVLALFLMLVLGFGIQPVIFAIALVYVPNFARLARNTTLAVKEEPYVQAARLMGQSNLRIMLREILPNIAAPMFVQLTVGFAFGIVIEAGLSFLGLGVQPPDPSLGVVMADGKDYFLAHPWVITLTGLTLMVIILGLNLLGDGLRDILDPRLRKRSMA